MKETLRAQADLPLSSDNDFRSYDFGSRCDVHISEDRYIDNSEGRNNLRLNVMLDFQAKDHQSYDLEAQVDNSHDIEEDDFEEASYHVEK